MSAQLCKMKNMSFNINVKYQRLGLCLNQKFCNDVTTEHFSEDRASNKLLTINP